MNHVTIDELIRSDLASVSDVMTSIFATAFAPDPDLTVSQWAEARRVLGTEESSEPGPWSNERSPFLVEPMDCLSVNDPTERVIMPKGAQVGGTEIGLNLTGYVADVAPGPMLFVEPTDTMAKRFSTQRLAPMFRSESLKGKLTEGSKKTSNTILSKKFRGGVVVMTGANSPVGLRSMPARFLVLDEIDAYKLNVGGEGDPVKLAEARTQTFGSRRKILEISTPLEMATSKVWRDFRQTDQCYYYVPCPHCHHMDFLRWDRMRWTPGKPETAAMWCDACERLIEERHKTWMFDLVRAEWRPTAVGRPNWRGFHLSSLYSPLGRKSWSDCVADFEEAESSPEQMQTFYNTVLGLPWEKLVEAIEPEVIYQRRESRDPGRVPARVAVLTAGVDCQAGRLEVSVWGWGAKLERWLIEHHVFFGDLTDREPWAALDDLRAKTWKTDDGRELGLAATAIDSGYRPMVVYRYVQTAVFAGHRNVIAIKGRATVDQPIRLGERREGSKRLKGAQAVDIYLVGTDYLKREIMGALAAPPRDPDKPAAGYVHLPLVDMNYCKQLVAEKQVEKRVGSAIKVAFVAVYPRNEALDCAIYARAAAAFLGLDGKAPRWFEAAIQRQTATAAFRVDQSTPPAVPQTRLDELVEATIAKTMEDDDEEGYALRKTAVDLRPKLREEARAALARQARGAVPDPDSSAAADDDPSPVKPKVRPRIIRSSWMKRR